MEPLEKAQKGLRLLKEAISETIANSHEGIGNSEVARQLELESDFEGSQKKISYLVSDWTTSK